MPNAARRTVIPALLSAGLLFAGAGHPAAAQGPTAALAAAVRAQNAHHSSQTAEPMVDDAIAVVMPGFDEHSRAGPWGVLVGRLEATVEMQRRKLPDTDDVANLPVLTVKVAGRKAIEIEGSEGFEGQPLFLVQVVEMDPDNPYPEIVFSSYTGGAHCCSDTAIATSTPDGRRWIAADAGMFDGGLVRAHDADGDGRYEIAEPDNRFLYRYACYACSVAPLQIFRLDGGRLVDVSREERYRGQQVAWLKGMVEEAGEEIDANGFLAGYVAQKMLLGEGEEALALMRAHYDRGSDWDIEECSLPLDAAGDCPGRMLRLDFPEALALFLRNSGYDRR